MKEVIRTTDQVKFVIYTCVKDSWLFKKNIFLKRYVAVLGIIPQGPVGPDIFVWQFFHCFCCTLIESRHHKYFVSFSQQKRGVYFFKESVGLGLK